MSAVRTMHNCLQAAVAAMQAFPLATDAGASDETRNGNQPFRPWLERDRVTLSWIAGRENSCPKCHARAWHVGRITAECAACAMVLPIVNPSAKGSLQ